MANRVGVFMTADEPEEAWAIVDLNGLEVQPQCYTMGFFINGKRQDCSGCIAI